ncbi:helix-turn-helix domain-containing protein [Haladaptatus sp. GCM10025893]|uniref:helix-turn-helix domain-containing protein n=1 Tax=Haladaptatus sp. GCM10025893 TaxID=3252659 RepID=UPI003613CD4F
MSEDFEVQSVVTNTSHHGDGAGVVGEVTIDEDTSRQPAAESLAPVFADGDRAVYRYERETADCPCGKIPTHGCPIRDIRATKGSLTFSFFAPDVETVRAIVCDLRACSSSVHLHRLTQSVDDDQALLVVNRAAFTDRQYEVLETAHELGYFARPRESDATSVARALDISVATFSEHLAVAQEKLLDQLLGE